MKIHPPTVIVLFGFFAFAGLALALLPQKGTAASDRCPIVELGETQEDCPWAGVARKLEAASAHGHDLLPVFEQELPRLAKDLRADSQARKDWLQLWGVSINFDEMAKGQIVNADILALLSSQLRLSEPVLPGTAESKYRVHAGMEHTYGYLFSLLKTSFGYKRARWVRDDIEKGFGFPRGTLGPLPQEGTLFSNITYFTGMIAFQDDVRESELLMRDRSGVAAELIAFPYAMQRRDRLVETVVIDSRAIEIRTDLVHFQVPGENSALLVYSIKDSAAPLAKLITAFPVQAGFVKTVLNPENLGENRPVTTRYNAYVEGLTGVKPPLTGSRKIR